MSEAPASDAESAPCTSKAREATPPSEAGSRLAQFLAEQILRNNPTAKLTTKQVLNWAREADNMLRLDRRSENQIYEVIKWGQKNPFWRAIILSMAKVREKFDQLTVMMQSNANENGRK